MSELREFLKAKGVLEKYDNNVKEDVKRYGLELEDSDLEVALIGAFPWAITPEGHEFWSKLDDEFNSRNN